MPNPREPLDNFGVFTRQKPQVPEFDELSSRLEALEPKLNHIRKIQPLISEIPFINDLCCPFGAARSRCEYILKQCKAEIDKRKDLEHTFVEEGQGSVKDSAQSVKLIILNYVTYLELRVEGMEKYLGREPFGSAVPRGWMFEDLEYGVRGGPIEFNKNKERTAVEVLVRVRR